MAGSIPGAANCKDLFTPPSNDGWGIRPLLLFIADERVREWLIFLASPFVLSVARRAKSKHRWLFSTLLGATTGSLLPASGLATMRQLESQNWSKYPTHSVSPFFSRVFSQIEHFVHSFVTPTQRLSG